MIIMKKSDKKIEKKRVKEVKKNRKKMATTLDWIDIDSIDSKSVILKKDKQIRELRGIKLDPHDIFLDTPGEQLYRIQQLRMCLNSIKSKIYHGFVFNPVNLDSHLSRLFRQLDYEDDVVIQQMIEDDIEKALGFANNYRELEFFIIIKGKPGEKFEKAIYQLEYEFNRAQFSFKPLNRLDWENYIAYSFENQMINDYYFSRGIFDLEKEGVK
ncbi:MAG: hypothetical protein RR598_08440 [Anaerorhabdus sp.]